MEITNTYKYNVTLRLKGDVVMSLNAGDEFEAQRKAQELFNDFATLIAPPQTVDWSLGIGEAESQMVPNSDPKFKCDFEGGYEHARWGEDLPPDSSLGFKAGWLAQSDRDNRRYNHPRRNQCRSGYRSFTVVRQYKS